MQELPGVIIPGTDKARGSLFGPVGLEERIPAGHPLRKVRPALNEALASLDAGFPALYTEGDSRSFADMIFACLANQVSEKHPSRFWP